MHTESARKSKPRSPDFNNNREIKGHGRINCRSRLGTRNPVKKEIQKILMDRFSYDSRPDSEPPASHKDFTA